jgi:hypothetical protein
VGDVEGCLRRDAMRVVRFLRELRGGLCVHSPTLASTGVELDTFPGLSIVAMSLRHWIHHDPQPPPGAVVLYACMGN